MILGRFTKQPYEEFYFGAEFSNVVDTDNESIELSSSSVTAVDNTGASTTDVYDSATLAVTNNTILAVRVKAGAENLSPYKITYKVVTSTGNKYEKDVLMYVEEI